MDVLDADELELYVGVIIFIFVAFSCSSVGDGIQLKTKEEKHGGKKDYSEASGPGTGCLEITPEHTAQNWSSCAMLLRSGSYWAHLGPGVHHIHEVTVGIGPHDGL